MADRVINLFDGMVADDAPVTRIPRPITSLLELHGS
jgi:hypothetical protein